MIITIDGLTATGKSSVARLVAQKLNIMHLNSGLLFRALGYLLSKYYGYGKAELLHPSEEAIAGCLDPQRLVYQYDTNTQQASVIYDGQDITPFLMTKEVDLSASLVATQAIVQASITTLLRTLAIRASRCVVDGRNAGSIMFPDAQIKIVLTATLAVRAERWRKARGAGMTQEQAAAYIDERDMRDIQRTVAPFIVPAGAYTIDTSLLTLEQTCQKILDYKVAQKKNKI